MEIKDLLIILNVAENNICQTMQQALRTGVWPSRKVGVSAALERINFLQYLSQLRKVDGSEKENDGDGANAKSMHLSIPGFLCMYETPENEKVRLIEHMTIGATVSQGIDP